VRLLLALGAAVLVLFVVFFVALKALGGGDDVDCSGFRLKPGQWQSTRPDDRSELQIKISMCRALQGRPAGEVQALLGPPSGTRSSAVEVLSYRFGPRDVRYMEVRLRGGRVYEIGRVTTSGPLPA
jgi:hypothetical protein